MATSGREHHTTYDLVAINCDEVFKVVWCPLARRPLQLRADLFEGRSPLTVSLEGLSVFGARLPNVDDVHLVTLTCVPPPNKPVIGPVFARRMKRLGVVASALSRPEVPLGRVVASWELRRPPAEPLPIS